MPLRQLRVLWLTVKAAALIFISGRCLAILSAQEGISGSIFLAKLFEQTCVHFMKILIVSFINTKSANTTQIVCLCRAKPLRQRVQTQISGIL